MELAPVPQEPKPNLWAEFEVDCFSGGTSPGVRWRAGNNTNGTHIFSLLHNDKLVFDFKVEPGETKSSALHSHLWEDSYQFFEIKWTSQDKRLAATQPWLNCVEPELTYTFGEVDHNGDPCAGLVDIEFTNDGTQTAQVRLGVGGPAHESQFTVGTGATEAKQIHVGAGTIVWASYLNHGHHEYFLEAKAVDCDEDLPDPPVPAVPDGDDVNDPPEPPDPDAGDGDGDGGNGGGPQVDDAPGEPGGTWQEVDEPDPGVVDRLPDPVMKDRGDHSSDPLPHGTQVAGLTLDREIGLLLERAPLPGTASDTAGAPLWAFWLVAVALAAITTRVVLNRA
jgi:hypothetical protein